MTEPGAVLEAVHTAIADLAAVLVAVRSGLGGDCVRVGSHLEMGEIDLLSARDAVEKALSVGSIVLRSSAPESISVAAGAEVRSRLPGRRRAGTRRHRFPGHSQGEFVLGTRRHLACLAVGVSRSGQNLVAPCCARTSTDLRRWHVHPSRGRGSGDFAVSLRPLRLRYDRP